MNDPQVVAKKDVFAFRMLRYLGRGCSYWKSYTETTVIDREALRGCVQPEAFDETFPATVRAVFRVVIKDETPVAIEILTNDIAIVIDDEPAYADAIVPFNECFVKMLINGVDIICFRQQTN